MSDPAPQNFKHHARFDPGFHFVLLPVLVANLIVSIVHLVQHPHLYSAWLVVLSVAVFVLVFKLRRYPLKVQDRVIRLEERLRLQALAPVEWRARIYRLSEGQLIGLRFASDHEVVELAQQALERFPSSYIRRSGIGVNLSWRFSAKTERDGTSIFG